MSDTVAGLHHVTAVAGDPEDNLAFYTDVLGLRLVKRTVNFDDTSTYHLYYGDETGRPGTILTFFPREDGQQGRLGRGQATSTSFVVPEGSLDYWADRLRSHDVDVGPTREQFGETVLPFRDPDGLAFELVAGESPVDPWTGGPVPEEHAIRGLHGVALHPLKPDDTGAVLELLGYEQVAETERRVRYRADGDRAAVVDLLTGHGPDGAEGVGTVHHVAFRAPDEESQDRWRERLSDASLQVTQPKDRHYFRSIYFREPGGVLFEIATDGPGFTEDEPVSDLGSDLQLPPWLEDERDYIENQLPDFPQST